MIPAFFSFTATDDWVSLADLYDDSVGFAQGTTTYLGFKGAVVAHKDNGDSIQIRQKNNEDNYVDVLMSELEPQEYFFVDGCNIASIQVKGLDLVLKLFGVSSGGW